MKLKGAQIAIDMYSCKDEILSDCKKVEEILQKQLMTIKLVLILFTIMLTKMENTLSVFHANVVI